MIPKLLKIGQNWESHALTENFPAVSHLLERELSSWGSSWWVWWRKPCRAGWWWRVAAAASWPVQRTQRSPSHVAFSQRSSTSPSSSTATRHRLLARFIIINRQNDFNCWNFERESTASVEAAGGSAAAAVRSSDEWCGDDWLWQWHWRATRITQSSSLDAQPAVIDSLWHQSVVSQGRSNVSCLSQ